MAAVMGDNGMLKKKENGCMHPLLIALRSRPLDILPDVSLRAFQHFIGGYSHRFATEGISIDWQYDHRAFHDWLCARYQVKGAMAIADTTIVRSFSISEDAAFAKFFTLLDEYQHTVRSVQDMGCVACEKMTFVELLTALRKRPELYVWYETFAGCCAFLMGDELAYHEIGLPPDEGREIFRGFQEWVVQEKNQAGQKRLWFKVIEFWSGGIDCGYTSSGAWSLFWKWFDQYVKLIGKEQLFGEPTGSPKTGGVCFPAK